MRSERKFGNNFLMSAHAQVIIAAPIHRRTLYAVLILIIELRKMLCALIHFKKMPVCTTLFEQLQLFFQYILIVDHLIFIYTFLVNLVNLLTCQPWFKPNRGAEKVSSTINSSCHLWFIVSKSLLIAIANTYFPRVSAPPRLTALL